MKAKPHFLKEDDSTSLSRKVRKSGPGTGQLETLRPPELFHQWERGSGPRVMVSACLLGIRCRYDGRHSLCPDLVEFLPSSSFIPFCPEQLGGLPTPRPRANMKDGDGHDILVGAGRVISADGKDVTEDFVRGAYEALRLAQLTGTLLAIMKDKSPSCGLRTAFGDKPSGSGAGVTAALFKSEGIEIIELGANDTFPAQRFLKLMKEVYG